MTSKGSWRQVIEMALIMSAIAAVIGGFFWFVEANQGSAIDRAKYQRGDVIVHRLGQTGIVTSHTTQFGEWAYYVTTSGPDGTTKACWQSKEIVNP